MKQLLLLITWFLSSQALAQNYLTIIQKNGDEFSFGFTDKPVITYSATDLVMATEKTTVQFPLEGLAKFVFTDQPTSVPTIETAVDLSVWDNVVSMTGLKAQAKVEVISTDGKVVFTYKASPEGTLSFSIAELPASTYIIKTESLTCKILKK